MEFADGMTANFGSKGWELVTILTAEITLMTVYSPQGKHAYTNFPVHRVFFKRPAQ